MDLKSQIKMDKLPQHVAIIMDGNGRWARKRGNERIFGHRNAVESVRQVVEAAGELGVGYLTLYAFSTENWKRPRTEVEALMSLLVSTIRNETDKLHQNNVRLMAIGSLADLPKSIREQLEQSIEHTKNNTGLRLVLALSYSGRWEIADAARKMAEAVRDGSLKPEDIDACTISSFMISAAIPDPDLLIRTSGEHRISNFLLWQLAYTELYFTPVLWPDFRKEHFYEAVIDFQRRDRRFGKISDEVKAETVNN